MSESKFTPGPWGASCAGNNEAEGCHCGYVFDNGDKTICQVLHNDLEKDPAHYERLEGNISIEEKNANADLISAAPDMYEALQNLVDEQNGPPLIRYAASWQAAMDKARAAIAKAEGVTP